MNFESIKMGFLNYLEEKLSENKKSEEDAAYEAAELYNLSNSSIFTNSTEFKNYLVEEVGADVSIFSKSIDEIMSMDFVDGKFVEKEEGNSDTFEYSGLFTDILNSALENENVINTFDADKSGQLDKSEVGVFLEGFASDSENEGNITFDNLAETVSDIEVATTEGTKEDETIKNVKGLLLDKIYTNEKVIETLDLDGDKTLSDEEKAKFEEFITGYAGSSNEELSIEDINKALTDILDGKFSYGEEKVAEEKEPKVDDEPGKTSTQATNNSGASNGVSGGSGNYSSGGTGGVSNSSSSTTPAGPKTIENMTLEELEAEKKEKTADVTKAQEEVNAVHSGKNEAVKGAEDDCKEKETAYKKAVEEDKNISKEVKDKLSKNLDAINKKEDSIDKIKVDINNKDGEITAQETVITSDKSNISALESAISSLNSAEAKDDEQKAEINSKKTKAQAQLKEAKNKLSKDNDKLSKLKEEKTKLEDNLKKEEDALTKLEKEKADIEKEIEKNCAPETKEAMKAYNEAKEKVETVKNEELKKAQDNLTKAQEELDKINAQIDTKKAEKETSKYSANQSDLPDDLAAKLNEKLGAGFTDRLSEIAKKYGCSEQDLIGLMYSESGLNPQAQNSNGGATGLIQFMPSTAKTLGTTTSELKNMNGTQQLEYVDKYLGQYLKEGGNYSAGDLYTTVFLPAYLNKDILTTSGENYYKWNSGLDTDKNGDISKDDLTKRVKSKYEEALRSFA